MTFASFGFACDCDECEIKEIPLPILEALQNRKRQKRETEPMPRTQVRTLVQRHSNGNGGIVAIWNWFLPREATEPLVEFGNSHRIIWVQRFPKTSQLQYVGRGIIGSRDEERTRTNMDWEQGQVYLLPSNQGKAVGWIHHVLTSSEGATTTAAAAANDSNKEDNGEGGPIVMNIAKIPMEQVKDVQFEQDVNESLPNWVSTLVKCCYEGLKRIPERLEDASTSKQSCRPPQYFKYSGEEQTALIHAFAQAAKQDETASSSMANPPVPTPNSQT